MPSAQVNPVLRFIRSLAPAEADGEPGDGQLLARFVRHRDEAAFAALLRRHGPMVLGVCRRLLHDPNDADDAFQATFLVLVRKARSIGRPDLLGNWLYGVAYRTALKARAGAARRRAELRPLPEVAMTDPCDEVLWRDLRPVLDEELSRLPDKYRSAVVLCDLEGWTHEEAARRLGCPRETVTTRLTRARARLRRRLAGRGLTLSAGLLTTVLAERAAPAAVPAGLTDLTLRAAASVAVGRAAAGVVSPQVAALTGGVLRAMFWNQLTRAAVLLLAVSLLGAGVSVLARRVPAGEQGARQTEPPARPAAEDRDPLRGTWKVVSAEWMGRPDTSHPGETWTFADGRIRVEREGAKPEFTYRLDRAADPGRIDLNPTEKSEVGYHYRGIYRLEKGRLTVCAAVVRKGETNEKLRPTAFTTQPGDLHRLWVLEREARPGRSERAPSDREKLQGTWVVVSGEHNAIPFEEGRSRGHCIRFKGDEVIFEPTADKTRVTFTVDPAKTPRVLTMTAQEGPTKGKAIPWIYELDGDRLKLCWDSQEGKKVPAKFATEPGSGLSLLVLRRLAPGEKLPEAEELQAPAADPASKPDPARQERDKLQGTWQAVAGEADGQALPEEVVKDYKMVVTGDRVKLTKAGEGGEGTLKLDPTQKPKTIDVEISENEKGVGIYELTGDRLRLCLVEGDGTLTRPAEFAGKDRAVLIEFKRVPAKKKP